MLGFGLAGELVYESGLAGARLARDEEKLGFTRERTVQKALKPSKLLLSTDKYLLVHDDG
jgi:hypothetical protein